MPIRRASAPGLSAASLNAYLQSKGSPMADQGDNLMKVGKEYDIDPRLLIALSNAESGFGKNLNIGANNAWGWKWNGNNSPFVSWLTGMTSVAKGLTGHPKVYNLSDANTLYSAYCHGPCKAGHKALRESMNEQGADMNALAFPDMPGAKP